MVHRPRPSRRLRLAEPLQPRGRPDPGAAHQYRRRPRPTQGLAHRHPRHLDRQGGDDVMHGNEFTITEEDLRLPRTWDSIAAEIRDEQIEHLNANLGTELRYGPGTWLH